MTTKPTARSEGQTKLNSYATYGMLGGLFLGLIVGVVASGPHFSEWPALRSLSVVLGSGIAGSILGYILSGLAFGAVAAGSDEQSHATDDDRGSDDSGSCGGDGDGGHCVS